MDTINALSAIRAIGSSTSDGGTRQQFQQQAQPGQILTATVLEKTDNNLFYLDILGNKILAQSDSVSLSPGVKLKLEVVSTSPEFELKIVSKDQALFFGKTLTLLEENLDISNLLTKIETSQSSILKELSSQSQNGLKEFFSLQHSFLDGNTRGEHLKLLLDKLGLNIESILASNTKTDGCGQTLKSALVEITTLLQSGSELAEITHKLIGTIELYQLAQLKLNDDNLLLFPLPLPFLNHGYLIVNKDENGRATYEGNIAKQFSLHLNLEPLGNLEISFLESGDGIYVRFLCDSEEKAIFTKSYQEDLKDLLSEKKVLGLSFSDGAQTPAHTLIQQVIPVGKGILDTKI